MQKTKIEPEKHEFIYASIARMTYAESQAQKTNTASQKYKVPEYNKVQNYIRRSRLVFIE